MVEKICRIITDSKIGNINPAFALAEEIAKKIPLKIEHIQVKDNLFFRFIPVFLIKFLGLSKYIGRFYGIYHNSQVVLTIGNGSASIVPTVALRLNEYQDSNLAKKTIFIQLQNPRISPHYYDYVIAPMHDNVRSHNAIPTIGSLSRVNSILETSDLKKNTMFSSLDKPIFAIFIGGTNSRYVFSAKEATEFAQFLLNFSITNKVSLVITCSRRTGQENEVILRRLLKGDNIYFPTEEDGNPYYMMLKYCDASIITCDSVNMISDSVVAGLQTFIYNLPGENGKFTYFYNALKRRGLLFDATYEYQHKRVGKLNETERVAQIIIAALEKKESK
jgi:mitochondrial fission protein ELM1